MVESGRPPASSPPAAPYGYRNVMSFDMGGTTARWASSRMASSAWPRRSSGRAGGPRSARAAAAYPSTPVIDLVGLAPAVAELDRRRRRVRGPAQLRPARAACYVAAPRRPSRTRTWCWAAWTPRTSWAARWRWMRGRAPRSPARRRALALDPWPPAGIVEISNAHDRRHAPGVMRAARSPPVRAGGLRRRSCTPTPGLAGIPPCWSMNPGIAAVGV
jgi:hypothetical protein